jgi:hypothetical protein
MTQKCRTSNDVARQVRQHSTGWRIRATGAHRLIEGAAAQVKLR